MTELNFTRYWTEEEIEKVRPMIREVLEDFPDLAIDEIQVGRTTTARGRFHRERNTKHDLYLQFNPDEISKFTIAHELHHHFTREKIIDLRTLAMGEKYLDSRPSYLAKENLIEDMEEFNQLFEEDPELVVDIAQDALRQDDVDPVAYFENQVKSGVKRTKTNDV